MNIQCRQSTNYGWRLTVGKIYEVISETDSSYFIIDDQGEQSDFAKHRFVITDDSYVLPYKWQIQRTIENYHAINKWLSNKYPYHNFKDEFYDSYDGYANNWNDSINDRIAGVPLITFEQFKEHFLKQKEIIGYKSPYDLFGGEVKKDTIYYPFLSHEKSVYYYTKEKDGTVLAKYFLPKEIVETWESVIKVHEQSVRLSNGKSVLIKGKSVYAENQEITISQLEYLLIPHLLIINNWSVNITDITYKIGCWENIKMNDIQQIIKTYKDINS